MQFYQFLHVFATLDDVVTPVDNSNNDRDAEDENHIQDSDDDGQSDREHDEVDPDENNTSVGKTRVHMVPWCSGEL